MVQVRLERRTDPGEHEAIEQADCRGRWRRHIRLPWRKGEVGIRDRKPAPTVAEFAKNDFMPHVRTRFADKAATLAYYQIQVKHLTGYGPLAGAAV